MHEGVESSNQGARGALATLIWHLSLKWPYSSHVSHFARACALDVLYICWVKGTLSRR